MRWRESSRACAIVEDRREIDQRRYHEKRNSTFVYMHPCHSSTVSAIEMEVPELRISEFVVIALLLSLELSSQRIFQVQKAKYTN
jgi:hypothetical protein